MTGRLIAIGDVHGAAIALEQLWDAVRPTKDDTIVLLGDYIDRGHNSRGVIQFLIDRSSDCQVIPLLGNHEEMYLRATRSRSSWRRWLELGGQATLDSYGKRGRLADIPITHREWLTNCPLYWESASHFFVHANFDPRKSLDQQRRETILWQALDERLPTLHLSGKQAVIGHTVQASGRPLCLDHLCCLDTGCGLGGWLTALDVRSGAIWQCNEIGLLRSQ